MNPFIIKSSCFLGIAAMTMTACFKNDTSFNQDIPITISDVPKETITNRNEIIVDEAIPEEIINMLEKHFYAMATNDEEAFHSTLLPEDGADLNSEPYAMMTFQYYCNTNIYLKKISIYNQSPEEEWEFVKNKLNYIVELMVWNPNEQQDEIIFAQISKESSKWGISRYIQEELLF